MNNQKGKFIVFYGLNNLGKTTQAQLLVENLKKNGLKAKYVKYPRYEKMPTGKIISNYLREGNYYNLSPRELQILYAFNREQCEEEIKEDLENGVHIISECYTGTGLAWGEAEGIDKEFLRHINSHLLKEDLAFHFRGRRFRDSIEKSHIHENNRILTRKAQIAFELMSEEFGWVDLNANYPIVEIEKQVYSYVLEYINNSLKPSFSPDFKALSNLKKEQEKFGYLEKNKDFQNTPRNIFNRSSFKKVSVKRLSPLAKIPDSTDGYVYNLYAHGYYSIASGKNEMVSTAIKLFLPENFIAMISSNLGHFSCALNTRNTDEIKINWHNSTNEAININPGQIVGHITFQKLTDPINPKS